MNKRVAFAITSTLPLLILAASMTVAAQQTKSGVTFSNPVLEKLRRVRGYRHLATLRAALKQELKIDTTTSKKQAA